MARVILDTCLLIAVERGQAALDELIRPDDDAVIAAVTAAELLTGVERAGTEPIRQRRQDFVDAILATVPVEDYTLEAARAHARLLAYVQREGRPRGAHDLLIAATSVVTARMLRSTDGKAKFGDLPGVHVA
ncbi:PIN domain-containing protein [Nocardia sp. R16R-3T]